MALDEWLEKAVPEVMSHLAKCHSCSMASNTKRGINLAGQQAVRDVVDDLIGILFPGCHGQEALEDGEFGPYLEDKVKKVATTLVQQIERAFEYQCEVDKDCNDCDDCLEKAEDAVRYLIEALPGIQKALQEDVVAAYEGDPAARSTMEIVMSYPCIVAIATHRIAHLLYEKNVPLIPRIMSEYAHSKTGVDIHPGATIGSGFFIDHGTGVVIGETTVIGDRVKLYQGVTLGAMSFPLDEDGNPVKGVKRHPNIEDRVTIYAEATLLGNITIGAGSEIGGNVWLTHDIPPDSAVYNKQPKAMITQKPSSKSSD